MPDPQQNQPAAPAGYTQAQVDQYNAMRQLISRGSARIGDILNAEFNGRPPLRPEEMSRFAGDHLNPTVNLKWSKMQNLGNTNSATGTIELNQELNSPNLDYKTLYPPSRNFRQLVPTTAHEAFHAAEGLGTVARIKTAIFQPDSTVASLNDRMDGYFGEGMNRVLSMGENQQQNAARLKKVEDGQKTGNDDPSVYYFRNAERLTRTHTLMAFAARDNNGAIPKTKMEMYRVMELAGFDLPQAQADALYNTKEGQDAQKKFKTLGESKGVLSVNAYRNKVNELSPEQKKAFYEQVVPSDAGVVLNVLGHKNGLKAMGINAPDMENTRSFLHDVLQSQEAGTPSSKFTPAQWQADAKKVDPAYVGQAFLVAKNHFNAEAMRALIKERREEISPFLDKFYGPGKGKETLDYYQKYLDEHPSRAQNMDNNKDVQHAANLARPSGVVADISHRPSPTQALAQDHSHTGPAQEAA